MNEEKEPDLSSGKALDMLHGPLMKKIIFFALPIAASSILQQLFNSADVAVAGRFAESGALAAVGSNSVLVGLFVNLFAGLSVGTNAFSASVVLYILAHEDEMIRLRWNRLHIHGAALKRIVQIGAPAALQSAVFSISNICIQTAINSFGSSAVAGMTAALNFEYIGYFIVGAFSQTVVTFIGQNYGAGQYGRCKKILRLCLAGGMAGTLLATSVFIIARGTVIRIFTVDPAEIEYAMARFLYAMPFLFLTSTYEIAGSALRGMGKSTLPAIFTLLGTVVFRVFWVYVIFPLWNSFLALVVVYPVSWVLTGTMMILYYLGQRGKLFAKDQGRQELL